jgi:hypothetical protein
MNKQYIYRVCMQHDNGKITIDTVADSADKAKEIVCNAERAPLCAAIAATRMQQIA